jgi:hypothetical protein
MNDVALALVRAVSRLFSTPWSATDTLSGPGAGIGNQRGTIACATATAAGRAYSAWLPDGDRCRR